MTEERGILHVLDMLDDVKKSVGTHKDYIDQKIDFMNKSVVNMEDSFDEKIKAFTDKFEVSVSDFSAISDRSFMAINTVKALKDEVMTTEKFETGLGTLIENYASWFKNIENDLEETIKEFGERFGSLGVFIKSQEKHLQELGETSNRMSRSVSVAISLIEKITEDTKEVLPRLDANTVKINKCFDRQDNIDVRMKKMDDKLNDSLRSFESMRSDVIDRLKKLEEEVKQKASFEVSNKSMKDIENLKQEVEKRPSTQNDISRQSFEWQEQMEKKFARLEKKIND